MSLLCDWYGILSACVNDTHYSDTGQTRFNSFMIVSAIGCGQHVYLSILFIAKEIDFIILCDVSRV